MGKLQGSFRLFSEGLPCPPDAPSFPILHMVAEHLKPGDVLDLGGGMGAYGLGLQRLGRIVTVSDINPAYLKISQENGLAIFRPTESQPLPQKGWDNVVLLDVLEHVDNPQEFLAMACRTARRRVVFTVPCTEGFAELFNLGLTYSHVAVTDHLHHFDDQALAELLMPWKDRSHVVKRDFLFPHFAWTSIRRAFRNKFLAELCLVPLRLANRLGFVRKTNASRYLVSVDVDD